jgi:hypothetical protein
MQSPFKPCCVRVRRTLPAAGCRFKKSRAWGHRAFSRGGKKFRHSSVHDVKAVGKGEAGRRDGARAVVLVMSDPAEIGHSPQYFSQVAMGCSYNGMKISNGVRVSGYKTWHK